MNAYFQILNARLSSDTNKPCINSGLEAIVATSSRNKLALLSEQQLAETSGTSDSR